MNKEVYRQEIADWDQNARFYENENQMAYTTKIYRREIYDFYGIKEGEVVLEAGGGVIKAGPKTVIVDFSPKMIEACRQINPPEKCILASVHALPFEAGAFDVVAANGTLHHLKVQGLFDESMREFWRVLKPGGRLCIFDRANNPFPRIFFFIRKPFKKIWQPKSTCSTSHETEFLEEDVTRVLKSGFELERRKYIINIFFQAIVILANIIQYLFGFKAAYWWQKITWPPAYLIEKIFNFKVLCAEQIIVMKKSK